VTTYNQDFAGGAGALGAGDSITQMHATQTINRDGAGHAQLSAAPADGKDVDVFITGTYGANQSVRFDVSTWIPNGSVNLLARINTPGTSNNTYKAYFDDSSFTGGGVAWGTLTIGKNVGGVFSQLGSAIDIRTNPITTGDAVWMKVTGASPATIEVYRRRAGVDVLLGTRTDSTYSAGNLGFGLWWDGIGSRQQIDNVVATDTIPVAFDAVGPSAGGDAAALTVGSNITRTWIHTCSGTNRAVFVGIAVGVAVNDVDSSVTINGVTYGGVAMTFIGRRHSGDSNAGYTELWVLVNPATGAQNVVVTYTDAGSIGLATIEEGSVSFTDVDQTTPYDGYVTAAGNSAAPSLTISSAVGNMTLAMLTAGAALGGVTQTTRWINNWTTASAAGNGAQSTAAGAASVTHAASLGGADFWAILGVNVRAVVLALSPQGVFPESGALNDDTLDDMTLNDEVVSGTLYTQSLSGGFTPGGALNKQTSRILAGGFTPSGTIQRLTNRLLAGGFTPSGALAKSKISFLSVTGGFTPSGGLTKLVNKVLSGGFTPSGAIQRLTNRLLAGGFTPSGTVVKRASRSVSGGVAPAGALAKQTNRALSGGFTPSGTLSSIRIFLRSFTGGFTPSGTLTKLTSRLLAGGFTPSGALSKLTSRILAGGFTPSGSLSKRTNRSLVGGFTPSGAMTTLKIFLRSLAGGFTPSGALARQPNKVLGGAVAPTGAIAKRTNKTLGGAVAPAGSVAKRTSRAFLGSVTFTGVLSSFKGNRQVDLTGGIAPSGTLLTGRIYARIISGSIIPTGTVQRLTRKAISGQIGLSGQITKVTVRNVFLNGVIAPTGTLLHRVWLGILMLGKIVARATTWIRSIGGSTHRVDSKSESTYEPRAQGAPEYDPTSTSESEDTTNG
jgi:hypothetical protein